MSSLPIEKPSLVVNENLERSAVPTAGGLSAVSMIKESGAVSLSSYKFRASDFHKESQAHFNKAFKDMLAAFQWCEDHLSANMRELLIDLAVELGMLRLRFVEWLEQHGLSQSEAATCYLSYRSIPSSDSNFGELPSLDPLWTLALDHGWEWLCPWKSNAEIEAEKAAKEAAEVAERAAKAETERALKAASMRYRLQSFTDLMDAPPQRWLVHQVLPEIGLGALYGPPGSGKSFLLLDLCISVASGTQWFGHLVKAPVPVVYVVLEGEGGFGQRAKAWATEHSNAPLPERLHFITQAFNLRADRDVSDLCEAVLVAGGKGGLIVLDTLSRAAPGTDENSASDMGELIAACSRIQRETHCMILIVHHTGKTEGKGLRGHSSLLGAVDCAIETSRVGECREWTLAKSRDSGDGLRSGFTLKRVTIGANEYGHPLTSYVVEPMSGPALRPKKKLPAPLQELKPILEELSKSTGSGPVQFGEVCKIAKAKHEAEGKSFRKDNVRRAYAKYYNTAPPSDDTLVSF